MRRFLLTLAFAAIATTTLMADKCVFGDVEKGNQKDAPTEQVE